MASPLIPWLMGVNAVPKYRFEEIAYNSTEKKIPSEDDKHTYIGLEHLDSGTMTVTRWGSEVAPIGEKLVMRKGDVLFGKRRAYQKKVAIAPFDGIFSAHGMVLRPKEKAVTKEFFPLFISSDYFLNEAIRISVGSLSPTINWRDLKELEFSLPTIEEQSRISPLIWAAIRAKEAYKKMLESTDNLVKSQFIEMFGDPVTNTQNREVKPFGFFMENIRYGTSQPPNFSEDGAFMFIRATNIKSGRIVDEGMLRISSDEASKIEKCKLQGGEIIIVRSGANTGDTCVIEEKYAGNYAGYDIIIKPNPRTADPVFFNELLNTHYMQQVIKPLTVRSAQPHINTQQVQAMPMLCVPIEDQKKFREFVEQSDKSKFVGENFKFKINNLAGRNQNVY
jgi:type I restriction enzyme, S subunit